MSRIGWMAKLRHALSGHGGRHEGGTTSADWPDDRFHRCDHDRHGNDNQADPYGNVAGIAPGDKGLVLSD
jgi:hypothetical protein